MIPLQVLPDRRLDEWVDPFDSGPLLAKSLETVQVNIGLRCNLACHHCHVESGPSRTEEMSWETMQAVLRTIEMIQPRTLDITGGAPEMHPRFREFVCEAKSLGVRVIVRTNLTILLQERYADFPPFFRDHQIHLIASLPCYLEENVDRQRGRGVYHDSIEAIRRLNSLGYGVEDSLPLDLVFNPAGPSLPPPESRLEADYHRELARRFGIHFSRLITLTNMPIGRFLHDLTRTGRDEMYWNLLQSSFNPATVDGLMCRHQLHVGWDGTLYDCDFNFALGLSAAMPHHANIREFDVEHFRNRAIVTGRHCLACTAGAGSSCGGALA